MPAPLAAAIAAEGGRVPFARFMELALTHPEAGYYTSLERRLGERGDFTTAPRRVPAFNRSVGRLLAGLLDALTEAGARDVALVEVGPGEGDLAEGILDLWESERPDLKQPVELVLVEVGPGLRLLQEERLASARGAGWNVTWAGDLRAASADGAVVFSNELLDALPVHRVRAAHGALTEAWVRIDGKGAPLEEWAELSARAAAELELLFGGAPPAEIERFSRDGEFELRPAVDEYLAQAAAAFHALFVLTIDYGDWLGGPPQPLGERCGSGGAGGEVPTPVLHGRSLRGYYRHHRRHELYSGAGRQDLTADVDFRALALHGARRDFDCLTFRSLATMMRAFGVQAEVESIARAPYSIEADSDRAVLKGLLSEEGAGGIFKLMIQMREDQS